MPLHLQAVFWAKMVEQGRVIRAGQCWAGQGRVEQGKVEEDRARQSGAEGAG